MAEVIEMRSDMTVKLIRSMAADDDVIQAAQTSAKGENKPETIPARLIRSLMDNKHGVPFEHSYFRFYIECPIFVAREMIRHRMASTSEWSARYSEMLPMFYVPKADRPLVNQGTSMQPQLVAGSYMMQQVVDQANRETAEYTWKKYQFQLKYGVAKEVARMVLPVSVYTKFYWTVNARSLMNFLSLRVNSPDSMVPSFPLWEIQMVAEQMEEFFSQTMPVTHEAFVKNGRVAP